MLNTNILEKQNTLTNISTIKKNNYEEPIAENKNQISFGCMFKTENYTNSNNNNNNNIHEYNKSPFKLNKIVHNNCNYSFEK